MKRITERCWRNLDPWECCGQDRHCARNLYDDGGCINGCIVPKLYKQLAEYEDLEEKGLLLKLPCKVGDTVYIIGCKYRHGIYEKWINTGTFNYSDLEKLNKTVFLTKEEAEQKLKEMECAE